MKALASAAALLFACAALPPRPRWPRLRRRRNSMFRATTLNLAAYGEVKAAPDMATVISLGVQTQAPRPPPR